MSKADPYLVPVTFLIRADRMSELPAAREKVRKAIHKLARELRGEVTIEFDNRLGRGGVNFDEPFQQV